MGGGGGGMGNAFSGAYQGATSSMPPNLQGRGWDSAQNDWYNQQSQGAYAPTGPDYSSYGRRDWQREARQGGASGPLSSMLGGMLRQQGYEQGVGPYADLGNAPGGFFGYGQGGPQGGYQQSYNQIYNNPANYLQMGSQYGQLGSYNTLARDMASGNVGNYQFGGAMGPFAYQGGMNPQGRAGAWGAPQSASQMYGGLGGMAGRGGLGRGMGLNYPGGYGSPFQAVGSGSGYWNPQGRTPGQNPTATPWGGVSNRHPLSSFLRLPGGGQGSGNTAFDPRAMPPMPPGAMTTGANQADLMRQATIGREGSGLIDPNTAGQIQQITGGGTPPPPAMAEQGQYQYQPGQLYDQWRQGGAGASVLGGMSTQPIYQSDAWRRQQTGVPLPYQLPAAAGDIGKQRSQFLYGGGPWQQRAIGGGGAMW